MNVTVALRHGFAMALFLRSATVTHPRPRGTAMAWHRRPAPGNWASLKAQVMAAHDGRCHVCGHGQADQCDHIINVARGGTHDLDNLAPIHGTAYGTNPCPTCGRHCHQDKTKQEQAAGRATSNRNRARPTEQHPGRIA